MGERQLFIDFVGIGYFEHSYRSLGLHASFIDEITNLNDLEFLALHAYTASNIFYKIVNQALRDDSISVSCRAFITVLDRALVKMPKYKGLIYRGISVDMPINKILQLYSLGTQHCWKAYTSCSPYWVGAYKGNILFEIRAMEGRNLQFYTADNEDEILLPRNLWYKVDKLERVDKTVYVSLLQILVH